MPAKASDTDVLIVTFGDFRLDLRLRCVFRGTEKLKISPIPLNTLEFLVQNRHRVVSKVELLEAVWGGKRDVSTVEHAVSRLRRALRSDDAKDDYIETVPGRGYRFIAELGTPSPSVDDNVQTSSASRVVLASTTGTAAEGWLFSSRGRRTAFWVGAALVVCVAMVAGALFFREPQIAVVTAAGNTLIAKGIAGNILWTYQFGATLSDIRPEEVDWRTQIVDLNGDGKNEVLFAAPFQQDRQELFCFSARGKLLWTYRPEIHMEFNTRNLNGPWKIFQMLVTDEGNAKSIWVAVDHIIWWPAFIVKIAPDGTAKTAFTSSGLITSLLSVRTKSGDYVLAGGINNEYRMASLAVLAVNGPPATSPQGDGDKYQCIEGCPSGRPYRYILLPRSEVSIGSDRPYNTVVRMNSRQGGITVTTEELPSTGQYFDFSEDLKPERVVFSGDYPEMHRRYEVEGRISHAFEICPERHNLAILRIFDENGISRLVPVAREKNQ